MGQKTVTISNYQSVADIAIQELGNAEADFQLALANNISVTEELVPGQILIIPETVLKKPEILNSLSRNRQKISTGIMPDSIPQELDGIGYMGIRTTFTIS